MNIQDLKFDCRHFKGYIPCNPNKTYDVSCDNCEHYEVDSDKLTLIHDTTHKHPLFNKFKYLKDIFEICNFDDNVINENIHLSDKSQNNQEITKILFIKLGAIGDVIRTTPLITRYKKQYPNCEFSWITHSPEVLPKKKVQQIFRSGQ